MKREDIDIKCNLKQCLNNEENRCSEFIPTIVKKLKPNDKTCPYFEDSITNIKLREQLKHKKPQYDESLSEDQVEKIEKAKKRAQANLKKLAKEKDGTLPTKKKPKSKLSKFIE